MYIFEKAFQIAERVKKDLDGRVADGGINLPYVVSMVVCAGAGDHLEIGSLFGASAIAAALAKKEWNLPGKDFCIDPYEPRNPDLVKYQGPPDLFGGTPEALNANAIKFGVEDRIALVRAKSQPWPEPLTNSRFASAYIDGDHMGAVPWFDFIECARRTEHYVALDNFEEGYPDVVNAVLRAINGADWFLFFKQNTFCALRKSKKAGDRTLLDMMRT